MNSTMNGAGIAAVLAATGAGEAAGLELESLLRDLLAEHEQLLTLAGVQRTAITKADAAAMSTCVQQQNAIVQRVAGLERRRLALAARMMQGETREPARPTVSQLARSLSSPLRERVMAVTGRLREVMERLHKEHLALKEAAGALAGHMEGVMRQITGRLSHAGTYGRRGAVEARVQVVSALDLRT